MIVKVVEFQFLRIEENIAYGQPYARFVLKPDDTVELVGIGSRGKLIALRRIERGIPHLRKNVQIFIEDGGIDFLEAVSALKRLHSYNYSTKIFEMEYEKALEDTLE